MAQYDVNLREYWRIVRKRKFIVLFIAVILGIFSTSFAILKAPAPIYSTDCMIEIKRDRLVEGIYSKTIAWEDSDDIETQIAVIKSYAVFEKVAEHLNLIPRLASPRGENQMKTHVIATIENLQSKVEVSRIKYSSVLNIHVTDHDPAFAQRLANAVALVYRELHGEQQTKRAREALRYIDDQMREVRERLRDAEDRFNRFSKDNELISIDLQSETLLKQSKEIQGELAKLEEERRELDGLLKRLREFIKNPMGAGHNFDSIKANPRYQSANDSLVGLLLKRETLLKDFTPKHPEVVAISNEISETAKKMEYMLELQLKAQERKHEDASKELEKVDKKTKALLDKKLEYGRLKREVELYTEMTTLLERKNQEALIRRSEKPEEVNIVKPALLPTTPINPPRKFATGAMGVIIGVVLGLIIAFIVETFDTSLGAIEDVEQTLGIPVLGVIPHADLKAMQESIQERHSGRIRDHGLKQAVNLISHFVPKSMMAESFRALRTNIHFKDTEKKVRSLAITSTSPQEGKTLITLNMAITMAQSGLRTLLVGSDLRKPMLARVFGVAPSPGLSDILLGTYDWHETVRSVTDVLMGELSLEEVMITPGFDNFYFITGGAVPPNPAELIESARINQFIEEAKQEYDIILFDTAPILSAADPAILSTKVDGVLLVYRIGTVPKGLLKRGINQLLQVKANVIGVILNGMRPEVSPDFEEYKHYKYYYSYGEDGKERRKKKSFSIFETKELSLPRVQSSVSEKAAGWARKAWDKGRKRLGLSLIALAAVLLAAGLLQHNNGLGLLEPSGREQTDKTQKARIPIKEEPSRKVNTVQIPPPVAPAPPAVASTPPEPETVSQAGPRPGNAAAVLPTKQEPAAAEPTVPPVESKEEVPIAMPGIARTGKQERSPEVEEAKAEKIEAPKAPATGEKPKTDLVAAKPPAGGRYPFSLFLGSVPRLDLAEQAVSRYRRKGLFAYYSEVELSRGIWYRLYAGYFETAEQAEAFRKEKALEGADVKETPYANLVGTFGSREPLESKIESLRNLGFSAYAVRDGDGRQRLLVGAFHNEERAKRQQEELNAKGIENQIVKR